jgi:hypothetical protein
MKAAAAPLGFVGTEPENRRLSANGPEREYRGETRCAGSIISFGGE